MQEEKDKINRKSKKIVDDNFECYLAQEKITVDLSKSISKRLSKSIFERVEKFKVNCEIDWDLVMAEFEVNSEEYLKVKKKISNHYYYKKASAKKKKILRERSVRNVKTRGIFYNWYKSSSNVSDLK
ncbi:hypothetical protein SteCoe_7170 [Stentor coeruleus]|uniref:Uncharacterized protein n=1 Tax=Stentor coeruleus TaxID=5963 RepID=A0A1R2CN73_9CILI|nr:hypothetical protein SteCoe_7170 [Stentor coeruleus]